MFLLNTLTVPKIKDLVNKPNQQYKDIFETQAKAAGQAKHGQAKHGSDKHGSAPHGSAPHGSAPHANNAGQAKAGPNEEQITDELTSFLSDLKKTNVGKNATGPIIGTSDIDSLGYSLF